MEILTLLKLFQSKNYNKGMVPVNEHNKKALESILQDLDTYASTGLTRYVRLACNKLIDLDWSLNEDEDPYKYSDNL